MKFKTYLTEATKMPTGEKFVHSVVIGGKKVLMTRRGNKMSDPMILYIDGEEQKDFKGGKKQAIQFAKQKIN